MSYLANRTEDLCLEGSLSDNSERLLHSGRRGARLYRRFHNKDQTIETSKGYR